MRHFLLVINRRKTLQGFGSQCQSALWTLTCGELRLEGHLSDVHVPQHLYLARHQLLPDAREDRAHGTPLD